MAKRLQVLRGTTAENNAFRGKAGELSYDSTAKELRFHDNSTTGGFILQKKLTFDDAPTTNSNNAISSGAVKTAIDNAISGLKDIGSLEVGSYAFLFNKSSSAINKGASVNGQNLQARPFYQSGENMFSQSTSSTGNGAVTGTWKNVSGVNIIASVSSSQFSGGLFQRTA